MPEFNPLELVFLKARKGDTERFLDQATRVESALRHNGVHNDELKIMAFHTKRSNFGIVTFVAPYISEEDLADLDQYDMVCRADYVIVDGTFVKSRRGMLLHQTV